MVYWLRYVEKKRIGLVLLIAGIVLLIAGFYWTFIWMNVQLQQGSHVVKPGASFELSSYLGKSERTEGGFTVNGGSEEANLTIKDPSGKTIYTWYAKGSYGNGFTAEETGVYTMIFRNLDNVNDETIDVQFLSPYEPRFIVYDQTGLPLMIAGGIVLLFGIRSLRNA